jgi:Schlafen, AlbA_2
MPTIWDQAELQRHINDEVEESLNLEYKAGDALGTNNDKKKEITKDVSAMANSAGGTIIYGMKEYAQPDKKHLPEDFAPIDRTQFSKEWLEQIINSIQPRINGIIIHAVDLNTGPNDVAYVVEIPQSTTAHQARDKRYYKRFNFLSEPMEDYEIRDVMHRATLPDVDIEFSYDKIYPEGAFHPDFRLNIVVRNQGDQVVEKYKLHFTFPIFIFRNQAGDRNPSLNDPNFDFYGFYPNSDFSEYTITVKSKDVLFPQEGSDVGNIVGLNYKIDRDLHHRLMTKKNAGDEVTVRWVLYADNMPYKFGKIPFSTLYDPNR